MGRRADEVVCPALSITVLLCNLLLIMPSASFSIRKGVSDPESKLSKLTLGRVHKDYRKTVHPVVWDTDKRLYLKINGLNVLKTPKEGDKFMYVTFCEDNQGHEFLRAIDSHFEEVFDNLFQDDNTSVKPAFGKLIKLYLPYGSDKMLNYKKITFYDLDKKETTISSIKENVKIKVLVYLKGYQRYSDEIIPIWVLDHLIEENNKVQETPELPQEIPNEIPSEQEAQETEVNMDVIENHSILDSRSKNFLEMSDDSDFSVSE